MVYLISIFLSCFGPTLIGEAEHEFHISKALVEYNESEKALQVSMHIFIDDLEEALRLIGADKLYICTEKEFRDAEMVMEKYLKEHFILEVDGKAVQYDFLGKEPSEDLLGVWCYMEATEVDQISKLTVTNKLLMEVFSDQKNIISIIGPDRKKGVMLFEDEKFKESIEY